MNSNPIHLVHSLVQLGELPLGSAHRTQLVDVLRVQPFHDAVNVEAVRTLAPDQRAVVSGHFALRTATVERTSADSTVVIVVTVDPLPECDAFPALKTASGSSDFRGIGNYLVKAKREKKRD